MERSTPEDGSLTFPRGVGEYLPHYTALHSKTTVICLCNARRQISVCYFRGVSMENLFGSKKGSAPPDSTRVRVWESRNWCFPITRQLDLYHLPLEQGETGLEARPWDRRPWCYDDTQARIGDIAGHTKLVRTSERDRTQSSQILQL